MEAVDVLEDTQTKEIDTSAWHERFDKEVWRRESYHNREHIRAVKEAANKLIEAARNDSDPLGIIKELDRWNKDFPGARGSLGELGELADRAFDYHDLGNFMEGLKITDKGFEPEFLDRYTAAGAEERSKKFAIEAGREPLVIEFIEQTRFVERKDRKNYFATLVRVCDQIGNDIFSKNDKKVEGLVNEMTAENPEAVFRPSPYFFYNFAREQFPRLVNVGKTRDAVYKIWGLDEPDEVSGYPHTPVPMRRYMNDRKVAEEIIDRYGMLSAAAEEEFKKTTGKSLDEVVPTRPLHEIPKP